MTRSQPDARTLAAAEADDVREFSGMPRKHSRDFFDQKYNAGRSDDLSSLWATPERPLLTRRDKAIIAACTVGALCLIAHAVLAMPITPAPYTGPGYENCRGRC